MVSFSQLTNLLDDNDKRQSAAQWIERGVGRLEQLMTSHGYSMSNRLTDAKRLTNPTTQLVETWKALGEVLADYALPEEGDDYTDAEKAIRKMRDHLSKACDAILDKDQLGITSRHVLLATEQWARHIEDLSVYVHLDPPIREWHLDLLVKRENAVEQEKHALDVLYRLPKKEEGVCFSPRDV